MGRKLFLVVLVGLFCLSNVTRGIFRSKVAAPRFSAEGAAHFRYTDIVVRDGAVAALDRKAQWPEGLRVYRETAIGMEYLYGFAYRMVPWRKPDLARFVRFFTAFLFSLGIFPLAFLSSALWQRRSAGIFSAILFAVSIPLVARSSGFELIRENVTFVFLLYHIYLTVSSWTRGGWARPMLSGLFLGLALATWQGTQFYLIPFLVYCILRGVMVVVPAGERRSALVAAVFVIATGASVPFLRSGAFVLSVPAALAAALIAVSIIDLRRPAARAGRDGEGYGETLRRRSLKAAAAAAACACVIVPAVLSKGHFAAYSHFLGLVLHKVRLLRKPSDPTLLPFDVRAFWVGPYHSPDPLHFFVFALPLVCMLPNPVARLVVRARDGGCRELFTLAFLVFFFVLFMLMQRLLPLFGIFAAVAAGGCVLEFRWGATGRGIGSPYAAATVVLLCVMALQIFGWEGRADVWRRAARALRIPSREQFVVYPVEGDVEGALLSWIRRNTEQDAVIMTLHYLSPQVLTYTGRATNLNDFFESPRLRRKAERLLKLLYSGEDRLLHFCRQQESDYLIVGVSAGCDPTSDSPLFAAGLLNMPPGCAAYRLLFEPERLDSFDLVYENEMYRLFRVGRVGAERRWPRSPLFYEKELLWRAGGDIGAFYDTVMDIYALTSSGRRLLAAGNEREAERRLARALRTFYFYPAWRPLVDLYSRGRRLEEREALSELAYQYDPYRIDVCLELARSRLDLGKRDGVRELLERCSLLHVSERERREAERLMQRLEAAK